MAFVTKRTTTLTICLRVVEESDDAPPPPVIETTGEALAEIARPLAKALPKVLAMPSRKAVG